jgi:hypothetical protein
MVSMIMTTALAMSVVQANAWTADVVFIAIARTRRSDIPSGQRLDEVRIAHVQPGCHFKRAARARTRKEFALFGAIPRISAWHFRC